jgi:hypothetical protein
MNIVVEHILERPGFYYSLKALGSALYVCKSWRVEVLRVFREKNIPHLLCMMASAFSGNTPVRIHLTQLLLDQIREIMANPHIPDDASFNDLCNASPNFMGSGLQPSPQQYAYMTTHAISFEKQYANGDFRKVSRIIHNEVITMPSLAPRSVCSEYDRFVAENVIPESLQASTQTCDNYIKYHISYILVWYGLLI